MKLDTKAFRYLSPDDWRVLTAVEIGSKNHEVVPTPLIVQLSSLRTGSNTVHKSISVLAKANLIARVKNAKYDGYRLAYGGLDYLALHAHAKSDAITHLGSQMGVGKESDIYLVTTPASVEGASPVQSILKIHRLGRTSFRSLNKNRSYQGHRTHCSWQYLSRLSAQKEYIAMCALYNAGFPVPKPIAWNRHTVVMSLVPGIPLRQVPLSAFNPAGRSDDDDSRVGADTIEQITKLYNAIQELALELASVGVIHGDFNEFNILIENVPDPASDAARKEMKPWLIDFPQITSLTHSNADFYFHRDVQCIKDFFRKKYNYSAGIWVSTEGGITAVSEQNQAEFPTSPEDSSTVVEVEDELPSSVEDHSTVIEREDETPTSAEDGSTMIDGKDIPSFSDAVSRLRRSQSEKRRRIDVEIEAAGFSRKMAKELSKYYDEDETHRHGGAVIDGESADVALEPFSVQEDESNDGKHSELDSINQLHDKEEIDSAGRETIRQELSSGLQSVYLETPATPLSQSVAPQLPSKETSLLKTTEKQIRTKTAAGWVI